MSVLYTDDPLDSSDIKLEPTTSKRSYLVGQANIDQIIKKAQADRLISKKIIK